MEILKNRKDGKKEHERCAELAKDDEKVVEVQIRNVNMWYNMQQCYM